MIFVVNPLLSIMNEKLLKKLLVQTSIVNFRSPILVHLHRARARISKVNKFPFGNVNKERVPILVRFVYFWNSVEKFGSLKPYVI